MHTGITGVLSWWDEPSSETQPSAIAKIKNERDDRDADFENTEIDETLAAIAEEG
ncbi:hypothetical protein ACWD3J_16370 [Streptomyces sp. NPDC002755]